MIYPQDDNADKLIDRMPPEWLVLDIGGWAKTMPRANAVIDIQPYETRTKRRPEDEYFSKENWIIMDFGGSMEYRLPFDDHFFDFVWCQQTLEDIANPFKLMREMQRVAKAGFIEIPNREIESAIGIDSLNFPGYCHHRWCGELIGSGDNMEFVLTMKSPFISQYGLCEVPDKRNLGFVWDGSFNFSENVLLTKEAIIQDIIDFKNIRRFGQAGVY